MLLAEVPVGIWLGETVALGLFLSDGCCCAGLQVLRVRSILLPRTGTVLDTIWSCSYSKSKLFTETRLITGNNMNAHSLASFLSNTPSLPMLMWELCWCLSPHRCLWETIFGGHEGAEQERQGQGSPSNS